MQKIDNRVGSEIGLAGHYADLPAYQIVNNAHGRFSNLSSRLVDLQYGPWDQVIESLPQWEAIQAKKLHLAGEVMSLHGNPIEAARLSDEIMRLDKSVDEIETLLKNRNVAP